MTKVWTKYDLERKRGWRVGAGSDESNPAPKVLTNFIPKFLLLEKIS